MSKNKSKRESVLNNIKQWNQLYFMKVLALVTILCGVIGSYLYYLPYASKLLDEADRLPMWKVFFATLFSTLKLYMASPTVGLTENVNIYYEIARFLAPIYTATLGVQIFKKASLNTWNKIKSLGKKKIFVYGYNQKSLVMINNVIEEQRKSKEGKKRIVLLVDENLTDQERIELLVMGIVIKYINLKMTSGFDNKYIFNNLNINEEDIFILMSMEDEKNLKLLYSIRDYVKNNKVNFETPLKFRVLCENYGIKSMIINLDKECLEMMDIKTFNYAELGVQNLFSSKEGMIFNSSRFRNRDDQFDVKMMILGFGQIGQEVLSQAISNSVVSADNKIEFDVFDYKMEEKREFFLQRFHQDMSCEVDTQDVKTVSVVLNGIDYGESRIKINFHSYDIRKNTFKKAVGQYASQITYVAICFDDVENIVRTLDSLRPYLDSHVPIALRIPSSKISIAYIKNEFKEFRNIFSFCSEKDILSYENIVNEKLDKIAFENHMRYLAISNIHNKEQEKNEKDLIKDWNKLTTFYKNSNRAQALHKSMKVEYLNIVKTSGHVMDLIEKFLDQDVDHEALYQHISSNVELMNLAQIEHRRWSYYLIQNGYSYCDSVQFQEKLKEYKVIVNDELKLYPEIEYSKIKNDFKEAYKIHDLLVPWKILLSRINNQNSSILFYDLIPWMILYKD